jgi:hypothetical protein
MRRAILALLALFLLGTGANPFPGTGQPLGPSLPPTGWQTPYAPNPFTVPICAADPCTPANVDPNSTSMINFVMTNAGGFTLGELNVRQPGANAVGTDHQPVYYASPVDPLYNVTCDGTPGECGPLPVSIRIPNGAAASNANDHRFQVIEANGTEYAFEQFNDNGTGTGTIAPVYGGGTVSVLGGGYATALNMYAGRGSCSTCNGESAWIPLQPTLLDGLELVNGAINHTFSLAVYCPSHLFVWPAAHSDGPTPACDAGPEEGEYIWLNLTDAQINALGFCSWETTMLLAMHHYGMIVAATGGAPGPWGYYAYDDRSQQLWGGVGNWTLFWNWLSSSCPSAVPGFAGGTSHMLLNTTGILQTNLEVVFQ